MQPARWNDVADLQCDIPTKPICSGYLNFKVHVAANYFIQLVSTRFGRTFDEFRRRRRCLLRVRGRRTHGEHDSGPRLTSAPPCNVVR
jgi:hypothetical protein